MCPRLVHTRYGLEQMHHAEQSQGKLIHADVVLGD